MIHPPLKICSQGEGKSEPHIGRTKEVKSMMKAGDRFIIDPLVCEDEDVLEWYKNQPEKVLIWFGGTKRAGKRKRRTPK